MSTNDVYVCNCNGAGVNNGDVIEEDTLDMPSMWNESAFNPNMSGPTSAVNNGSGSAADEEPLVMPSMWDNGPTPTTNKQNAGHATSEADSEGLLPTDWNWGA